MRLTLACSVPTSRDDTGCWYANWRLIANFLDLLEDLEAKVLGTGLALTFGAVSLETDGSPEGSLYGLKTYCFILFGGGGIVTPFLVLKEYVRRLREIRVLCSGG